MQYLIMTFWITVTELALL